MKSVFYPVTQYHILLSHLFSQPGDSIVLDEKLFDRTLIDRIQQSAQWNEVFLLPRNKGVSGFLERFILKSGQTRKLLSLRDRKIRFFTYGDRSCVFTVNLLSKKNEIALMEDGLAPYYMRDLAKEWSRALSRETKEPLFDLLWKLYRIRTDSSFITSLDVLEPQLLEASVRKHWNCKRIDLSVQTVEHRLGTINDIFNYKAENNRLKYDIVYFDTAFNQNGYAEKEFELLLKLFATFEKRRVLVKFRNRKRGGVGVSRLELLEKIRDAFAGRITIDLFESDYPWEVIYLNNRQVLNKAVFVSIGISTVMLTPKLLLKQDQTSIICKKVLLSDFTATSNQSTSDRFSKKFNQFSEKGKIYIPDTFDDLQAILEKHFANKQEFHT